MGEGVLMAVSFFLVNLANFRDISGRCRLLRSAGDQAVVVGVSSGCHEGCSSEWKSRVVSGGEQ